MPLVSSSSPILAAQVEVALKLTVEPLQLEGGDLEADNEFEAEEQRHCWVVSVPLERRAKSVI